MALLLVTATALPLLRVDQWWIRVFDFPRVQITLACILLLPAYLFLREPKRIFDSVMLLLLTLALGYQVVKMFPYTKLMPLQVLASESDSDVIVTLETDSGWEKALRPL